MTQATMSGWKAYLGAGSPLSYTAIEECFEITGLGQQNAQIDATSFDSPDGTNEYIAGRSDGQEVTIRCNYIPGATNQGDWVSAVGAKVNRSFRVSYVSVSPAKTFTFTGTPISWNVVPSVSDRNVIEFVVKISGAITPG